MKKRILSLALILSASSLFANVELRHSSVYNCENELVINNKIINKKGFVPKFVDLEVGNISNAVFFTGDKKISSIQFFKDGFLLKNRIYTFKNEFSQDFQEMLKNTFAFGGICANKNDEIIPTNKDFNLIFTNTELSSELQLAIQKWAFAYAKYDVIASYKGNIRLSNEAEFAPKNIFDIEELSNIEASLRIKTEAIKKQAVLDLEDDYNRTLEAQKTNEYAVLYVHQSRIKLFEKISNLEK